MTCRLLAISAGVAVVLCVDHLAVAQGFGGSGSSAFRSSGTGSSGFGSSGFGSSGLGSSGFGSGGMGMSGFGSGMGSMGFGSSNLGSAGFGSSQFGSSGFGSAGFGGTSFGANSGYGNQGSAGFFGREADMQNGNAQGSRSMNQFFTQMNRNMRQSSRSQHKTTTTAQNPPQPTRVAVHAAFTPPQQSSNQLAETIRTRVTKILADHHMSPASLTMEGDIAVVRGVAASDSEREVIGQLLAIQPGVSGVRNEMTVAAASSGPVVPTPGS